MVEHWARAEDVKDMFDQVCQVIKWMRKDFAVVTFRLLREADPKKFKACVKTSKCFAELATKYAKFLTITCP